MTKAELIDRIARSRDLPPDVTKRCIGDVLDIAFEELATYFARARVTRTQTPRFTFPGFGTFTKKRRRARRGVNPRTLEPMEIEACETLDFRPSSELRTAMNGEGERGKHGSRKPKATVAAVRRGGENASDEAGLAVGSASAASTLPELPLARVRTTGKSQRRTGTG